MTNTASFEEMAHQPDQLRSQLDDVTDRLVDDYRNIPATVVRSCVRSESGRFAGARVYAYIPVLVERAARSRLNRRQRHRQGHLADSPRTLCPAPTVTHPASLTHDQDDA